VTLRKDGQGQPGLLRDGRSVLLRPLRSSDLDVLVAFHGRLSRQTIAMRLLGPVVHLSPDFLRRDVEATDGRFTIGAFLGHEIIAIGGITRTPDDPQRAEVTFIVEDRFQGLGLGGLLLERVASAARDTGVRTLEADVLPENERMLRTFAGSGYRMVQQRGSTVMHVTVVLDPTARVTARADRREHVAARSSLERLMRPAAVAVVGASRTPRSIGHAVVDNLVRQRFTGLVYPVNPHAERIAGLACYPSVAAIGRPVDLVMVAVPAASVSGVLADSAAAGAAAVVVLSTGFAEAGGEGRELEEQIVDLARTNGMRLLGPNCMGIVVPGPSSMVATFAPVTVAAGRIAMSSQSGPLGLAVLDHAQRLHLGLSGFVSIGNAADVTTTDLLQWWEDDPLTAAVLLHVEHFGDPRTFARTARRVSARKPLVAVHPAPAGDTADASEGVVYALFRQAGIIRASTLEEQFDLALLLATQPLPAGNGLAIVSNAGGPAALAAASARAHGLRISQLHDETVEAIEGSAPPGVRVVNPIDLTPHARAEHYGKVLTAVLADEAVDAALVLFVPPLVEQSAEVASAIVSASEATPSKPVIASYLSRSGLEPELTRGSRIVPSYAWPESGAVALGRVAEYARWRAAPAGVVRQLSAIDRDRAEHLVRISPAGWLEPAMATALLESFGIRCAEAGSELPDGRDTVVTVSHDPVFGPVVSFGVGGDYIDLFGDVARRITPLSDRDAAGLVRSVKAFPLLSGERGGSPHDVAALEDVLLRVSALVESQHRIADLQLNPLRVLPDGGGAVARAARVRLGE
jgi:acyl-CoA synthetase (NDP forming)/RimJ/RimL family protein N-acetyltransferase